MFREVPLLKVGLILMALGLLIAAVVVSVPLRSDPERVVAAEVATNSPGEAKRYSEPSQGELKSANAERHYELLPGAIMGLTIEATGIYDAPSSTPTAAGH